MTKIFVSVQYLIDLTFWKDYWLSMSNPTIRVYNFSSQWSFRGSPKKSCIIVYRNSLTSGNKLAAGNRRIVHSDMAYFDARIGFKIDVENFYSLMTVIYEPKIVLVGSVNRHHLTILQIAVGNTDKHVLWAIEGISVNDKKEKANGWYSSCKNLLKYYDSPPVLTTHITVSKRSIA